MSRRRASPYRAGRQEPFRRQQRGSKVTSLTGFLIPMKTRTEPLLIKADERQYVLVFSSPDTFQAGMYPALLQERGQLPISFAKFETVQAIVDHDDFLRSVPAELCGIAVDLRHYTTTEGQLRITWTEYDRR